MIYNNTSEEENGGGIYISDLSSDMIFNNLEFR